MNRLRVDFRTAVLGAFVGLFTFSVFLLVDRVEYYYDYLACLDTNVYDYCAGRAQNLRWMPYALWHVLMFVLASFVAHRYFVTLRDSPFLLWQLVFVGVLCAWGLTASSVVALDALMDGAEVDYERLTRGLDFGYIAKFFVAVFASNVACASFLHSAARQYAPESER